MIITLDVFSGRVNPEVTPDQDIWNYILLLLVKIMASPALDIEMPNINHLGYRGFHIDVYFLNGFRVYENYLTNGTQVWDAHGIESILLDLFEGRDGYHKDILTYHNT